MLSHWFNHDNFELRLKNFNSLSQKMNSENYLKVPTIPSCLLVQQQQNTQFNTSNSSLNSNGPSSNLNTNNHRGSGTNLRDSGCNLIRVPWKIVLLGDAGVGKSSLVRQFLNGCFSTLYNPTVEDSYQHNISLPDGASQCIEILDTSGFYQFPAMRELNIRLGAGFLLVFDIVKEETLNSLVSLHKEIISIKGTEKVPFILVGNKLDLSTSTPGQGDALIAEQVTRRAKLLAQTTFKCPFVETSAKENLNVAKTFTLVVEQVYRELEAALEALNAAANAENANNARRNSTISFVVRRISSTNLTVKPIERLSRRFSEPVACPELNPVAAAAAAGSTSAQPANSVLSVANPTKLASNHSIASTATTTTAGANLNATSKSSMKHSSSRDQQSSSSTAGSSSSSSKRKQKNCVIS